MADQVTSAKKNRQYSLFFLSWYNSTVCF